MVVSLTAGSRLFLLVKRPDRRRLIDVVAMDRLTFVGTCFGSRLCRWRRSWKYLVCGEAQVQPRSRRGRSNIFPTVYSQRPISPVPAVELSNSRSVGCMYVGCIQVGVWTEGARSLSTVGCVSNNSQ